MNAPLSVSASAEACYHCGLPADPSCSAPLAGVRQAFCCTGCFAVASTIVAGGLGDFYRFRDSDNARADHLGEDFSAYDLPELQSQYVADTEEGAREVWLRLDGLACAACAWLVESHLQSYSGIHSVRVNVAQNKAQVVWQPEFLALSEILQQIAAIGYRPSIWRQDDAEQARRADARRSLMRLGVAGIGMMQVGMYAVALHAGAFQDMTEPWRDFFRAVSALVATPVLFYSAQPFFLNAWRALKQRRLIMDVPVALALGLAYFASLYATATGGGEVYFDSVTMFAFFLLLGRYVEMRVRHSSALIGENSRTMQPLTVNRWSKSDAHWETVSTLALVVEDRIKIPAGEVLPCDGLVLDGLGQVDESIITGESQPRRVQIGDRVIAGSLNGDTALELKVTAVGADTQLAAIDRLTNTAALAKPDTLRLADRLASRFILAVLVACLAAGIVWWVMDPGRALWVMLAVLVATCPCALSLATPTALTAGIVNLRKRGIVVSSGTALEAITELDTVVLDKTGTLTEGRFSLAEVRLLDLTFTRERVLAIASALESHSRHPVARALSTLPSDLHAEAVEVVTSCGVVGTIAGQEYRIGSPQFVSPSAPPVFPGEGQWLLLGCGEQVLAWLRLEDRTREGLKALVSNLRNRGLHLELLSGDRAPNVAALAEPMALEYLAAQRPEDKFERLRALQSDGKQAMMIGDGLNDLPVLRAAKVSVAIGETTTSARQHADIIVLRHDLTAVLELFWVAGKVRKKIRQNFFWALGYNATVLPIAFLGLLAPWAAAIGMSLSSVIVVLNATRLKARHEEGTWTA